MDEQVFQKVNHPVDGGEVGRYSTDAGPVHHMALIIILRYTLAYMYSIQVEETVLAHFDTTHLYISCRP